MFMISVPQIQDLYEEVNGESGGDFEVIFVSSDEDTASCAAYMKEMHGNWLHIAFASPMVRAAPSRLTRPFPTRSHMPTLDLIPRQRNELKRRYGCCAGKEQGDVRVKERRNGIPALVGRSSPHPSPHAARHHAMIRGTEAFSWTSMSVCQNPSMRQSTD